jgi:corrinoid protein of di/trimethylamine methyltransferase
MSEDMLDQLRKGLIEGEPEPALAATNALLAAGVDPVVILEDGLTRAMLELGEMWKVGDVFLPEVVAAAEVFSMCNAVIEPVLLANADHELGARVVVATVKGDLHDLGKNMVIAMLKVAGFDVIDLGKDVEASVIVEAVREQQPLVVGLSALLTTTLPEQKVVIDALTAAGLRDQVKMIVGGAPVTQEWADAIGADAYAQHAPDAVRLMRELTGVGA